MESNALKSPSSSLPVDIVSPSEQNKRNKKRLCPFEDQTNKNNQKENHEPPKKKRKLMDTIKKIYQQNATHKQSNKLLKHKNMSLSNKNKTLQKQNAYYLSIMNQMCDIAQIKVNKNNKMDVNGQKCNHVNINTNNNEQTCDNSNINITSNKEPQKKARYAIIRKTIDENKQLMKLNLNLTSEYKKLKLENLSLVKTNNKLKHKLNTMINIVNETNSEDNKIPLLVLNECNVTTINHKSLTDITNDMNKNTNKSINDINDINNEMDMDINNSNCKNELKPNKQIRKENNETEQTFDTNMIHLHDSYSYYPDTRRAIQMREQERRKREKEYDQLSKNMMVDKDNKMVDIVVIE